MELFLIMWLILKNWWWFFLPIILAPVFSFFYLYWLRWEVWYPKFKWVILEIKPPAEILKPFRAMEDIFSLLWGIYDGPNWRERWCEGEIPLGGGLWFSFEIASFGGDIHFYARVPDGFQGTLEAAIYSQYPDVEISYVEDYTQKVPQDIPNKEWDLYSEDYTLGKDDVYPIKTYSMFFEERPEMVKEEKRIDPMDSLLEALAKLKPGEQLWFQMVTNPILGEFPFVAKGRSMANKIAKRPEPSKRKSIFQDVFEILTGAKSAEAPPKEEGLIAPELRLTPGEKEVLHGVETKISKKYYQTWMRLVYLYERDKPHFMGNYKIIRTYFNHFATENLNYLVFWGPTRTRIHYWLRERRLYLRKRQRLRSYIDRLPSLWPRTMKGDLIIPFGLASRGPGIRGTAILNIEELATIFHFPAKITALAPAVRPVEAKRGGPPPGLPVE